MSNKQIFKKSGVILVDNSKSGIHQIRVRVRVPKRIQTSAGLLFIVRIYNTLHTQLQLQGRVIIDSGIVEQQKQNQQ